MELLGVTFWVSDGELISSHCLLTDKSLLKRLDIPFFIHSIDGHDLPLGDGFAAVENFIETSGLESSRQRIEALDAAAVQFQEQLIRGVSRARVTREDGWQDVPTAVEELDVAVLTPEQLRM